VVSVHDLAFELYRDDFARLTGLKYRAIAPRAARSAQRVICVSHFTARDVIERYGVDEARVRVIGLAPALAAGFRAGAAGAGDAGDAGGAVVRGDARSRPYLLGVGDLRIKKDFVTLVRAWRQLRSEGFEHRLVLAGADAGEQQRLRAAAGDEPLELTGYVSDERLDALMRDAAALVHPSLYEGFGLVLLEAMARGTAVVAARATALPETGGDAALYFEPSDVDDLAARLRALLTDRALHDDLVARGRARAAEFSWEQTGRATADVYRELTA
jgi:glycosyltransferase involved in cell wall biosynthesis